VKFLAFWKTTVKKLGDQSPPVPTVVAPMVPCPHFRE